MWVITVTFLVGVGVGVAVSEPGRLFHLGVRAGHRHDVAQLAGVDRPEVGPGEHVRLHPVQIARLGDLVSTVDDGLPKRHLSADRDVGHRTQDALGIMRIDVVGRQEVGHLIERQRPLGQADDDGLNVRKQLDARKHHHPVFSEHVGPEPTGVGALAHLQEEPVGSVLQILDHLLGARQVVAIDLEAVDGNLVEHILAEDPHQLTLAERVASRRVGNGEVVTLEPDRVGEGGHQVGTTEETVVRVFGGITTCPFRHHQRELLDQLGGFHLELWTTQHEVVHDITEDADGHVQVVPREHSAPELVRVGQHLDGHIDVAAHAAGGVDSTLHGHRSPNRQFEQAISPLFEPDTGLTNHPVLSRIHQGIQLACGSRPLLGSARGRATARHEGLGGASEGVAGECHFPHGWYSFLLGRPRCGTAGS